MNVPTFFQWLREQTHRDDPVGDLARDFCADPEPADSVHRLRQKITDPVVRDVLDEAEAEWSDGKRLSAEHRATITRRIHRHLVTISDENLLMLDRIAMQASAVEWCSQEHEHDDHEASVRMVQEYVDTDILGVENVGFEGPFDPAEYR